MIRAATLVGIALACLSCGNSARSQEQALPPAPEDAAASNAEAAAVNEDVYRTRQTAITRAVAMASPAVVSINVIEVRRVQVRDPFSDWFSDPFFEQFFGRGRRRMLEQQVKALGSGFVISPDGYIVTNDHVVGRATRITVSFPDGETYEAELVGSDEATDIAVVKIKPDKELSHLKFSELEQPLVGEWAIALGNPFGLFEASEPTVTVGVVSAADRDFSVQQGRIYRDMIQTDASINRGNSGGPLLNALGEVIGVNTFIYSEGGGSVGLGFAVPSGKAVRIIEELKERGSIDRSYYTGLYGISVDQRIARAVGLDAPHGVFIQDVDPDSPADRAGFQPYDVIVAVQGEQVATRDDFVARIYDFRPGDVVEMDVVRGGEVREMSIQIGRRTG